MKLIVIDNSHFPLSQETEEFVKQLGKKNVTIYNYRKELYKNFWYYDILKDYSKEEFISDQATHDAVYVTQSGDGLVLPYKIPYFYNIYLYTYSHVPELGYKDFQKRYSQAKGASAVFVNDKKLNRFANWMDLNSYFINKPVNTYKYKFIRNRKFITPKLHIGFIPSSRLFGESHRNKIFEDMWASAKNNWILHIPDGRDLCIPDKNVVKHKVLSDSSFDYSEIYKHSHIMINPENIYHDDLDYSHSHYNFEAMSTGCVSICPNQHGTNSDYLFNDVHYFKLDYVDSNNLLDAIRIADKRREKLDRMSKAGSQLIKKYYDVRMVVQQKIQVMKNSL